jgi:hypothetical protein
MRIETDYNAIALALVERYPLEEVSRRVGCTVSNVSLLARGLTRVPVKKYRRAWVKAFHAEFPKKKLPMRSGKPYEINHQTSLPEVL